MIVGAGRVYLIGAGPGDPGLLTARGVRLLGLADVVVYDRNAEGVLRWARPEAERIAVGGPAEREAAQDAISLLLAEKARDGHTVARLKWGDPFLFASGAKEALLLHENGIPFEVVPGVPAAVGATAYAGIPLTYPGAGDAVVMLRGDDFETEMPPDVDWQAVAALEGTVVCHAGRRQIASMLRALVEAGAPRDRAAALIVAGASPSQQTQAATLGELMDQSTDTLPDGPCLIVVGDVVALRDHLRWFDQRPLFGRRIVVTRSPEQVGSLIDALENLGARAIEAPTFRILPPEDPEALERAAAAVDQFQWVVFEGASAVTRFLTAILRGPRDVRALGRVKIAAMGPSAADQLAAHGLTADVLVPELRSDKVTDALVEVGGPLRRQRVLIVRPDHLHGLVAQDLANEGAEVTDLVAYRTTPAPADAPASQALYRMLLEGEIDAVTFASPTAVSRFVDIIGAEQAADLLGTTVVAAIGPVTAAAALELGITPTIVADPYTIEGLVDGLARHFAPDRS